MVISLLRGVGADSVEVDIIQGDGGFASCWGENAVFDVCGIIPWRGKRVKRMKRREVVVLAPLHLNLWICIPHFS
jgi:hypothetical protein